MKLELISPEDELISKGSFGVLPDPMGYGRKVIKLRAILIPLKGNYTVDVFEIAADQKLRFLLKLIDFLLLIIHLKDKFLRYGKRSYPC